MRTVAVLPIKRFARAKQRLRSAVDGAAREALAEAMAADVLEVVSRITLIERVIVVTSEPTVAEAATEAGAHVVADPDEAGQSAAAALGVRAATRELGAQRALLLPGDTPGLSVREVEALLARAEPVVVVPDRHGTGTNALLLAPPGAIVPSFGPGSRARHEAAADAAGLKRATMSLPSLTHDVDTPEDLAALRARGGLGPRTTAALSGLAARAG